MGKAKGLEARARFRHRPARFCHSDFIGCGGLAGGTLSVSRRVDRRTPLFPAHPMNNPIEELTAKFLQTCDVAGESEQRVIERLTKRLHISRNAHEEFEAKLTVGERLADRIAVFGGSWTFILLFLAALVGWIVLNTVILGQRMGGKAFDAYPYIFLNLILSMLAALQAPVIMMSQNRHAAKDRVAAQHDYEVNLKSELEILALHQKVDTLREKQWEELVAMQQEQIKLLTRLLAAKG
jgi:uncharacterized membrane protein